MDPNACLARIIYLNEQMGELRHASLITLAPFRSELDGCARTYTTGSVRGGSPPTPTPRSGSSDSASTSTGSWPTRAPANTPRVTRPLPGPQPGRQQTMKTIPANKRNPRICESCGQHRATRSVFFDAIDNGNGDAWPAVAYALCDPCGEFPTPCAASRPRTRWT